MFVNPDRAVADTQIFFERENQVNNITPAQLRLGRFRKMFRF